jgi:cytoskeletal protein CcmA (bactofilin family)
MISTDDRMDPRNDSGLTVIAAGTKVQGPIDAAGDVCVAGRVDGKLRAGGTVTVLAGGAVTAELRAPRVRIEGAVIGNVYAGERIEVAAGARVVGDVRASVVELAAGATVEGRIDQRVPAAEFLVPDARATLRLARPMRRPTIPTPTLLSPTLSEEG